MPDETKDEIPLRIVDDREVIGSVESCWLIQDNFTRCVLRVLPLIPTAF